MSSRQRRADRERQKEDRQQSRSRQNSSGSRRGSHGEDRKSSEQEPKLVEFSVPAGKHPGDLITLSFQVQIPAGATQSFKVVPPKVVPEPQPKSTPRVRIPVGLEAGDSFQVSLDGLIVSVVVPEGKRAGDKMKVLPIASSAPEVPEKVVKIKIPEGSRGGMILTVQYEGKDHPVKIPAGLIAGDRFKWSPPIEGSSSEEEIQNESDIQMSGYLHKKKKNPAPLTRGYTKRWFVLTPGRLTYYEDEDSMEEKGEILLSEVEEIAAAEQDTDKHDFIVEGDGWEHKLRADSEDEMWEWIEELQRLCHAQ